MILAGDIGGTKTHVGLFESGDGGLVLLREGRYRSSDFPSLAAIVREFLTGSERVTAACFGVAGPVEEGRVRATNLPWLVDAGRLREALDGGRVALLNDVEALGLSLDELPREDFAPLQTGHGRLGNRAVIAAGTGLGEALLIWDGREHRAIATEGGHSDFAPRNDLEFDLLRFLAADYGHVSWERVVSGPGLVNLYRFLRDTGRGTEIPTVADRMRREDPAAVISEAALSRQCRLCEDSLELFASLYGAEAGNLALKSLAVNGVYLGGGIAPQILPRLQSGGFAKAFRDKGRMGAILDQVPIHVIVRRDAALWGAAHAASRVLLQETA